METKKNGVQAEAHTKEQTSGGHAHSHTHVLEDGTVVTHTHTHSHETYKSSAKPSLPCDRTPGVHQEMVENGRDCSEVLIQLSAVKAAINNTGKVILQDHIQHCLVDAIESGDMKEIEELNKAIDRFIK